MKEFNITGTCYPESHYMVNLDSRLAQIKQMVDAGKYFSINKGRQYGKTTTLRALSKYLNAEYIVIRLDFQGIGSFEFENERTFARAMARELYRLKSVKLHMSHEVQKEIKKIKSYDNSYLLADLFHVFGKWCEESENPIVLMIDEVDQASNNQVFLDFLAQLRKDYLNRDEIFTFQSVILAGVHDIRNLKLKIRPDSEHKHNSPWNIAAKFDVDMSFSPEDIAGMLEEYETDHQTGMNIPELSALIYEYTSGYPVLVSHICKIIDEELSVWNRESIVKAVGMIVSSKTMLFESLMNKLEDDEELKESVYSVLMSGDKLAYNPDDSSVDLALMYGFFKVTDGNVQIANRMFETRIYNAFLTSRKMQKAPIYKAGETDKPEFISKGHLNMELVLERFSQVYVNLYGDHPEDFQEHEGRKLFLLFLRPIINGTGNFYIEAETRNRRRTDVVVDYLGEQHIIEMKVWHGEKYHAEGEQQLADYLDYHHLKKGYLLTFNFNQEKETGIKHVQFGDKELIEVTV